MVNETMTTRRQASAVARVHSTPVFWIGSQYLQDGDWSAAYDEATHVLEREPDHLGAREALAISLLNLGDPVRSLEVIRSLVAVNPHENGYETLRANALQCLGRYAEALVALNRAYQMAKHENRKLQIAREMQIVAGMLMLEGNSGVDLKDFELPSELLVPVLDNRTLCPVIH